jgi:hypothetical protein
MNINNNTLTNLIWKYEILSETLNNSINQLN